MCKPVYAACKRLEDGASGFITKCLTSQDNLINVLKSLVTAEDVMLKLDIRWNSEVNPRNNYSLHKKLVFRNVANFNVKTNCFQRNVFGPWVYYCITCGFTFPLFLYF